MSPQEGRFSTQPELTQRLMALPVVLPALGSQYCQLSQDRRHKRLSSTTPRLILEHKGMEYSDTL